MPIHELPGIPSVGDAVSGVINDIAEAMWNFTDQMLMAVFSIVDANTVPSIVYTPGGPLGKVYPITLWIGIALVIMFSFAQIGKIASSAGQGVAAFGKGLVLYAFTFAAGLGLLDLLDQTAVTTADGILSAAFGSGHWSALSTNGTFAGAAVKNLSGVALAFLSIFMILPFAFGFLAEMIIREGAMLILAATLPIIAAGIVHEKFARWYWTGLRWMLALIFMLPVIAIAMAIGHSIALGAGTATGGGALSNLGAAVVGGTVSDMSLVMPLALFKLFAFVDPNTASGQSFRGGLPFGLGGSSDSSASSSPADATSGGGSGAGGGDGSDSDGGSDPASMKPGMGGGMDGGMSDAQSGLMGAAKSLFSGDQSGNAAHAGQSLDLVGAGHPGSGQGSGDSEDSQDSQDSNDSSDQGDAPDQDGQAPSPAQGPMPTSPIPDSPLPDSPMSGGSMPGAPSGAPGGVGDGGPGGGGSGGAAGGGDLAAAAVVA